MSKDNTEEHQIHQYILLYIFVAIRQLLLRPHAPHGHSASMLYPFLIASAISILPIPQQWTSTMPYRDVFMWIAADILQSSILFMYDIWKAYGVKTHVIHVISSIFLANLNFSRAHTHSQTSDQSIRQIFSQFCHLPANGARSKRGKWSVDDNLQRNHEPYHDTDNVPYVFRCGVSATAVALTGKLWDFATTITYIHTQADVAKNRKQKNPFYIIICYFRCNNI